MICSRGDIKDGMLDRDPYNVFLLPNTTIRYPSVLIELISTKESALVFGNISDTVYSEYCSGTTVVQSGYEDSINELLFCIISGNHDLLVIDDCINTSDFKWIENLVRVLKIPIIITIQSGSSFCYSTLFRNRECKIWVPYCCYSSDSKYRFNNYILKFEASTIFYYDDITCDRYHTPHKQQPETISKSIIPSVMFCPIYIMTSTILWSSMIIVICYLINSR